MQHLMNTHPILSILVIFYNNRREAPNTLYSLSAKYQSKVTSLQYNVIVIDSGSTEPLNKEEVLSYGPNFSYHKVSTKHPSPTEALRFGLGLIDTAYTGVIIDGAHILSPGILNYFFEIQSFKPNSFIYTTKYHLGDYHQNDSMTLGYNQEKEDQIIESVNWKDDGYLLYHICNFHQSPFNEFIDSAESNCFFISTDALRDSKIFDKPYYSIGGGFINLDVFKYFIENESFDNYLIIGEGTFHQFHGGASTNVERTQHPIKIYRNEYYEINKTPYVRPTYDSYYYGKYNNTISAFRPKTKVNHIKTFLDEGLILKNKKGLEHAIKEFPFHIPLRISLANFHEQKGDFDNAEKTLLAARAISRRTLQAPKHLFQFYYKQGKFDEARKYIDEAIDIDPTNPLLHLLRSQLAKATSDLARMNQHLQKAITYLDFGIGKNAKLNATIIFSLLQLGKIGVAGKYLKEALQHQPFHPDLISLAINIFPKTNDKDLFRTIAKRSVQIPDSKKPKQLLKRLGFAYQYIGDYQKSVTCYQAFLDNLDSEYSDEELHCYYNHILSLALSDQCRSAKEHLLKFNKYSNNKQFKHEVQLIEVVFKIDEDKIQAALMDILKLMQPLFSKAVFREVINRLLPHLNEAQTKSLYTAFLNHICGLPRNISPLHQELLQKIDTRNNTFNPNSQRQYSKTDGDSYDGFIFTHIQKTAGSSIRRFFAWATQLSKLPISKVHIPGTLGMQAATNTIQLSASKLKSLNARKIKLLLEHTSYHSEKPSHLKHLKKPFYFTILRNPFNRFVSHYYFFYYEKQDNYNCHLNELSDEFLDQYILKYKNIQTAYVSGIPWHSDIATTVLKEQLKVAKDNLNTKFHCFGIYENLEESIQLLKKKAPDWLIFPELPLPILNASIAPKMNINERVKSKFEEANKLDIELYSYAKKLFQVLNSPAENPQNINSEIIQVAVDLIYFKKEHDHSLKLIESSLPKNSPEYILFKTRILADIGQFNQAVILSGELMKIEDLTTLCYLLDFANENLILDLVNIGHKLRSYGDIEKSNRYMKYIYLEQERRNLVTRTTVIQQLIDQSSEKLYLEIGVFVGHNFLQIEANRKIAIDHNKRIKHTSQFSENTVFYEMTSDVFFEKQIDEILDKKIDVAFIDGLHTYEQSLNDVLNCLDYLKGDGFIVMHDCFPKTKAAAHPIQTVAQKMPSYQGFWNGDVFKTILWLRTNRPDLTVFVLDADHGLGIIYKKPAKKLLTLSEKEIKDMTFEIFKSNQSEYLNLKDKSIFKNWLVNLKKQELYS